MFEKTEDYKQARKASKDRITKVIKVWSAREETIHDEGFEKGAEFGYNKCKEEINQKGLALQSDMDKTIEQNIALKKELETANEWHKDLPIEDVILAIIEVEDCGYLLCEYRKGVWYDKGSSAVCKDWITRNIKRWKEIVLPKEIE